MDNEDSVNFMLKLLLHSFCQGFKFLHQAFLVYILKLELVALEKFAFAWVFAIARLKSSAKVLACLVRMKALTSEAIDDISLV